MAYSQIPAVKFTSHFLYRRKQRGISWEQIGECLCKSPVKELRDGRWYEIFRAGGVEVVKSDEGVFVTCCWLKGRRTRNNSKAQSKSCRKVRIGLKMRLRRLEEEE